MEQQAQNQFEGWAVVEIFGHQRAIGFVTTEYFGTACMFRVDTPELPEREVTIKQPRYGRIAGKEGLDQWLPSGTKVKEAAIPARSQLLGVGSIYRITPCTENTAKAAIEESISRPLIVLKLAKSKETPVLPSGRDDPEEDD